MSDDRKRDYIGDGVYVEYDGFGIIANANDCDNPTDSVYFEPSVVEAFIRFAKRMGIVREGIG